jgi:hypothetical protein
VLMLNLYLSAYITINLIQSMSFSVSGFYGVFRWSEGVWRAGEWQKLLLPVPEKEGIVLYWVSLVLIYNSIGSARGVRRTFLTKEQWIGHCLNWRIFRGWSSFLGVGPKKLSRSVLLFFIIFPANGL